MKLSNSVRYLVCAATCMFALSGHAITNSTSHAYPGGTGLAMQIGSDLYDSLDVKYRSKLEAQPISTVAAARPELGLTRGAANAPATRLHQLSVSDGFIKLINHIAHAKAIDRHEAGYFDRYMSDLALRTGPAASVEAPAIVGEQYWTDEVMNDQASYFNQMMGMTMAINLSHHYLGRSDKYADQLQSGQAVPINNFLTPSEWESGVRAGAVNSLNCALGTEGVKALFEAIGKMPQRPAWTDFIVPRHTDVKKLNKQLAKYEVDFFHGGLK